MKPQTTPMSPVGFFRQRAREVLPPSADQVFLEAVAAQADRLFGLIPEAVYLAAEVLGWEPALNEQDRVAVAALVLATLLNVDRGSTRLPIHGAGRAQLEADVQLLLEVSTTTPWTASILVSRALELAQSGALPNICGTPDGSPKPLVLDGDALYHHRHLSLESQFAAALSARLDTIVTALHGDITGTLGFLRQHPTRVGGHEILLNAEQQVAALMALHRPLTIISGGPGTGKTTLVVALLRLMCRLGLVEPQDIALAAPTGRAAARMKESIDAQLGSLTHADAVDASLREGLSKARTLHRLLGYAPSTDTFKHGAHNPLVAKLVVVDEASMIDLRLMEKLLRAVPPGARLVLVGDANQLPSVEAGAVLRDLVPEVCDLSGPWTQHVHGELEPQVQAPEPHSMQGHAVRLLRSYRTSTDLAGRTVHEISQLIRRGDPDALLPQPADKTLLWRRPSSPEQLEFQGVELWSPPELKLTTTALEHRALMAAYESFLDRWFVEAFSSLGSPGAAAAHQEQVEEWDMDEEDEEIFDRVWASAKGPVDKVPEWTDDFTFSANSIANLLGYTWVRGPDGFSQKDTAVITQLLRQLEAHRLLCVTRVGPLGSVKTNELLHVRLQTWLVTHLGATQAKASGEFAVGDPVIVLRNDYSRQLFNGDTGIVLRVAADPESRGTLTAVFPRQDRLSAYSVVALKGCIERAWALTVHKAQGSEYDVVGLVLPNEPMPLLTREILYTGVSRARSGVVIVGSEELFRVGVAKPVVRFCGVGERMSTAPCSLAVGEDSSSSSTQHQGA